MPERTIKKCVSDIALALLNATLILAIICLWFAWSAFSAAERVASELASVAETLTPVRGEVRELTNEVGALRDDLSSRTVLDPETKSELGGKIETLSSGIDGLNEKIGALQQNPDVLMERAIRQFFASLGVVVSESLVPERSPDTN